jgi:hypothetical protein
MTPVTGEEDVSPAGCHGDGRSRDSAVSMGCVGTFSFHRKCVLHSLLSTLSHFLYYLLTCAKRNMQMANNFIKAMQTVFISAT